MAELHLPWLELAVFVPLIGAGLLGRIRNVESGYRFAVGVALLTFLLALGEWIDFTSLKTFEATDHWHLFHRFTSLDIFVVDELSAPLAPLTALIFLMTVLATLPTKARRFPFRSSLLMLSLFMALLSSRDPWTLIVLLQLMNIPMWRNLRSRVGSARVFTLHMALSGGLLIIGQLILVFGDAVGSGAWGATFLALGCLTRSGALPVQCWMPHLFERASFGFAMLFVAPMPGAYAVMRLVYPVAPTWVLSAIAIASLITACYAAGMALAQIEARRFFCYIVLSFSSLILVGIELVNPVGLTGALCIWLSVSVALTGFGLTLRSIEARTGRLSLDEFNGLYTHTPRLAGLFLLTGLALIGFPGTTGFIGAELLIEGAVHFYPLVGVGVVLATAINGIAIMRGYLSVFTGSVHPASVCLRARNRERIPILALAALILGGGLAPQWQVSSRYHAGAELLKARSVTMGRAGEELKEPPYPEAVD